MKTGKSWMKELAAHHKEARQRFPKDKLMIVFDIDGTILDMRYMIVYVLQTYDQHHDTEYFQSLDVEDIRVHENHVDGLLRELGIPEEQQQEILDWFTEYRWTSDAILESHRPFRGVLEVIRWFQIQPDTFVSLNTGRPEVIRADTLRSINKLSKTYRVEFTNELLYMNPGDWEEDVENAKVKGIEHFIEQGYRVFAVIDNEPDNLKAMASIDADNQILLLHADTIFESKRTRMPAHTTKGKAFDLTELIPEEELPQNVQLAWHGINDVHNQRQFLASDIRWAECDVRFNPKRKEVYLRHDSFEDAPKQADEKALSLNELLGRLKESGKNVKLDLKDGGPLVDLALELVESHDLDSSQLWFNGNVERLKEEGFRKISTAYPDAIIQCPVDFLAPLVYSVPAKSKELLDYFAGWGINRFSISWTTSDMPEFFDQMDVWGLDVNIYNVPNLEAFLQAVLLMPRSVTSDFNFPEWHYYGRGSGQEGKHYEYKMR